MECRYLPFAVSPCRVFGVDLMAHINPLKQLTNWSRRPIVVGFLLCGLVVVPLGYIFLDLDKTEDTSWLADAGGKGLKVISFLLQFLPESHHYKIVFVRRSLPEVLASQQKMLERQGTEEETVDDKEMTKLFTDHLEKVEAHLNAQQNCDVLYIQHRETLNMPKKVAQQVNNFLGGRLDVEAMAEVVDQGLYRNRT